MRRFATSIFAVLLWTAPLAAENAASPHEMVLPDGEADSEKCSLCHEEGFALKMSKTDTCTLCHGMTPHAGAQEHMRVDAARVKRVFGDKREGQVELPLTDEGQIYCGTCHVFHDPRAYGNDKLLDKEWAPGASNAARAVRDSLQRKATEAEPTTELKFSDGTRRLRLPVDDGSLCKNCHDWTKK